MYHPKLPSSNWTISHIFPLFYRHFSTISHWFPAFPKILPRWTPAGATAPGTRSPGFVTRMGSSTHPVPWRQRPRWGGGSVVCFAGTILIFMDSMDVFCLFTLIYRGFSYHVWLMLGKTIMRKSILFGQDFWSIFGLRQDTKFGQPQTTTPAFLLYVCICIYIYVCIDTHTNNTYYIIYYIYYTHIYSVYIYIHINVCVYLHTHIAHAHAHAHPHTHTEIHIAVKWAFPIPTWLAQQFMATKVLQNCLAPPKCWTQPCQNSTELLVLGCVDLLESKTSKMVHIPRSFFCDFNIF